MLNCPRCGKSFPSKYYFVTADTCNECFSGLKPAEQQKLIESVESLKQQKASGRSVDGHRLQCPVCGGRAFWKRRTLMNTPGMTFWGVEWANKQAENFICDSCGYVYWFLREEI